MIYFFLTWGSLAGAGTVAPRAHITHTKQRLLFHGCVQAEPGHVHRVTGLLAVFAVSSKVCALPHTQALCFALAAVEFTHFTQLYLHI